MEEKGGKKIGVDIWGKKKIMKLIKMHFINAEMAQMEITLLTKKKLKTPLIRKKNPFTITTHSQITN